MMIYDKFCPDLSLQRMLIFKLHVILSGSLINLIVTGTYLVAETSYRDCVFGRNLQNRVVRERSSLTHLCNATCFVLSVALNSHMWLRLELKFCRCNGTPNVFLGDTIPEVLLWHLAWDCGGIVEGRDMGCEVANWPCSW